MGPPGSMPQASGGVTPPPQLQVAFRVCTFGVEKLSHAYRGNAAAQAMCKLWLPTRGRAPGPIPFKVVANALQQPWGGKVDIDVDARAFRPDKFSDTHERVGWQYTQASRR